VCTECLIAEAKVEAINLTFCHLCLGATLERLAPDVQGENATEATMALSRIAALFRSA
jgi:hypothetical protein